MKTKNFISKLRAVIQIAALVVFALLMTGVLGIVFLSPVQDAIFRFWPIGVCVLITYTVLSFAEDYLNNRIACRYTKLK